VLKNRKNCPSGLIFFILLQALLYCCLVSETAAIETVHFSAKVLYQKWIKLESGSVFNQREFWFVLAVCAGVVFLAILIFFAWNHSLRRQVAARTAQLNGELAERKNIENALRESEEKFILMVENANSIILRMDPVGNVTYFNKFAEDFFGFSRQEIVGRNVVGTIVPAVDSAGTDLEATMRDIGLHPERYTANENENMRKNGERVWVSWTNKPICDAAGKFIDLLCVGNDITPLKRVQQALKSERDFNAAIFDTAGALVVVFDTNAAIVRFNRTCEQVTGYAFDEVMGRPFWDLLLVPEETERIKGVFSNLMSGLFPNQAENFWKCKDGRLRLIAWYNTVMLDTKGAVAYIISTGIDITEHREAEIELERHHHHTEELVSQRTAELKKTVAQLEAEIVERKAAELKVAESERRYRFLFEESPAGNIIIGLDGAIKDINVYFQKTLGYAKEELIGKPAADFIAPKQRLQVTESLRRRLKGEEVDERDDAVIAKDGSEHFIIFSGRQTHLYEKDKLIGILVSGVDVTDRRKAEELAERQRRELIQADKLASLGILVSGVAHEVNNPNNFIILNSDNLRDIWNDILPVLDTYSADHRTFSLAGLRYSEVRDEVAQLITGISDGAKRIRTIVQSLKDFARQGPADMNRPISLNSVIEQSTVIVANLIKKSTDRFTVEYAPGLPEIRGDFQRIEQVMINLITNACQALTGRNQAVIVRTCFDSERHRIVAEVRDEGMGIPQENLKHIMDPFFTTKRDSGGTGLGLAISYGIVNDHRGQLTIESEAGKGTTVSVAFPEASDSGQGG
jgi:PAS domain S-box-containing protein